MTTPDQPNIASTDAQQPRWAILCGLARDEASTVAKLDTFARWKAEGRLDGVVVCWWKRVSDQNPHLVERVKSEGFVLVELPEPRLTVPGHYIHQSMTLWYALQATPDRAMVLKTRPDLVWLEDAHIERIIDADLAIRAPEGWPEVFRKRILTIGALPTAPYYINDIMFYGQREDLLRLAAFDLGPHYHSNWIEAEQLIHSPASRAFFPPLAAYLQIYPPFWHGHPGPALEMLDVQLASDAYLEVLATHLRVLNTYYLIGLDTQRAVDASSEAFARHSLKDILGSDLGLPGCRFLSGPGVTNFVGPEPIQALLEGAVLQDELGRRFVAVLERTADYDYVRNFSANPLRPDPRMTELAQALQRVRHAEYKTVWNPADAPERYEVRGSPDRSNVTDHTDAANRLERELNELRRAHQHLLNEVALIRSN